MLTPSELGIYTISVSIYMLLLTIVSGSMPTIISRNISQNSTDNMYKYKYVSNSIILSIILALVISGFVVLGKPIFSYIFTDDLSYELLLYLLPSILFMAIYSPIMGYFWGENNYFYVSIVEFVEQIIRIALSIILIYLNPFNNYLISTCIALTIACGISSLLGCILYKYKKAKFQFTMYYTKDITSCTTPLILMRFVGSCIQPIINVLVPICLVGIGYSTTDSLGLIGIIFGMCMPIITIPGTIIGSINMALLPDIAYYANNNVVLNKKIQTNFKYIVICCYILLPIFFVLAEPITSILYSNPSISYYLAASIWLIIPMGINQYLSSIMNALGKEKQNFIFSTISSIIMILFIVIFTRYLEIFALPLGLGINAIISSTLDIYTIKKTTCFSHNILSDILLNTLLIIPVILLDYFIYNILVYILPTICIILVISIISIISYLVLIITFQYIDIDYIHRYVLSKKSIYS